MKGFTFELRKTISLTALGLGSVFCLIAAVLFDNCIPAIIGIAFGTFISILNFNLLAKTSERIAGMDPGMAQTKITLNYLIRYVIYGAALLLSFKSPQIEPFGTVVGFFTTWIAIYITQILRYRKKD